MVVHFQNTALASGAMMSAVWLLGLAFLTESDVTSRFDHERGIRH